MLKSTTAIIDLDKINIPSNFKKKLPSETKIAERYRCYMKTGCFDREIVVDENYNLIDGYTTYLVCKMFGITKTRVLRIKVKLTVDESLDMLRTAVDRLVVTNIRPVEENNYDY